MIDDMLADVRIYGIPLALLEAQIMLDVDRTDYPSEWVSRGYPKWVG